MTEKYQPKGKWRTKLEKQQEPKVVDVPDQWKAKYGEGQMLIPRPLDVDALIRKIPKGKLVTQAQLRDKLAMDAGIDSCCPITTGIFVRISAEAAEEDRSEGVSKITPWWRVVTPKGELNPKFPGGALLQAKLLENEGHTIELIKGKKLLRVKNFDKRLVKL